jgi:purine-nucleoside/S-methyl-5'-thioadenosine phosphorylase / adenosine deaminase
VAVTRVSLGPARVWCTSRAGGVSAAPYDSCNLGDHVGDAPDAVAANRERVGADAGLGDPSGWVWMRQVHGVDVHVATGPTGAVPPAVDAAVTATRGLPLAVLTADCAPVVLACDDAVGVVHAGHRGLEQGVIPAAVEQLRAVGRGSVSAYLGPCIRPARYEFGAADLARLVERLGPDVEGRTHDGRPALDIPAAVRAALRVAGVEELVDGGACTASSDAYFSYRRDGVTGRQATIVVLPES